MLALTKIEATMWVGCVVAALGYGSIASPADTDFRFGHFRHTEGGIELQRASEADAEEAVPNLPFVPGDRVWSDALGHAEIRLIDGSLVWLGPDTKLDYSAHEGTGQSERVFLRLWAGSLAVRSWAEPPLEIVIETPSGAVALTRAGLARVDVEPERTRLTVTEGAAVLSANDLDLTVAQSEWAEARAGDEPRGPWAVEPDEMDAFDEWVSEREQTARFASEHRGRIPDELEPQAAELDAHGTWYYEADAGYVWRPHVTLDWQPYSNGRWSWTPFGWTWIPDEPWGWVPFHYGRWGYSPRMGWYWAPSTTWGPAWVSWAIGPRHIGWCALDRRDRPVRGPHHNQRGRQRGGHAVPRGPSDRHPGAGGPDGAWHFVRRDDFHARDLARRRVDGLSPRAPGLRLAESTHLVPSRRLSEMTAPDRGALARLRHPRPDGGSPSRTRWRAAGAAGRAPWSRSGLRQRSGTRDGMEPESRDREGRNRSRAGSAASWDTPGASVRARGRYRRSLDDDGVSQRTQRTRDDERRRLGQRQWTRPDSGTEPYPSRWQPRDPDRDGGTRPRGYGRERSGGTDRSTRADDARVPDRVFRHLENDSRPSGRDDRGSRPDVRSRDAREAGRQRDAGSGGSRPSGHGREERRSGGAARRHR